MAKTGKAARAAGNDVSDEDRLALTHRAAIAPNTYFDGREYRPATDDEIAGVEQVRAVAERMADDNAAAEAAAGDGGEIVTQST